MARLSSYLRERGYEVMTSPEAFSIIATNGFSDNFNSVDGMLRAIQHAVLDLQVSIEDSFEVLLRSSGKPSVLLCDRGLMDGKAYVTEEEWQTMLSQRRGLHDCDFREGRYNAIFHLVTAAEGADAYYTLENNEVRSETAVEARALDQRTQKAWSGHPKLIVFDNSTNFEGKLQRLVSATAKLVGLPSELSREPAKFILNSPPDLAQFPPDVSYHVFDVEKVYLSESQNHEEYSFIRKRSHENGLGTVYGITTVHKTKPSQVIERKRIITRREYQSALVLNRDKSRYIIQQTRISFLWQMQSFNIHIYKRPVDSICILHAQSESTLDLTIPPFLNVLRKLNSSEDNEDNKYGAYCISLKDKCSNNNYSSNENHSNDDDDSERLDNQGGISANEEDE